ncbi:hypothetical protein D3C72_1806620 [compost metagenome]
MQQTIISGKVQPPEQKRQKQLHAQLAGFMHWMQRPKDAGEVQKDKQRSVPAGMLPMVF